ncbi:MAG: cupin domain-containing protein [Microbacteriaceae bacterium]
MSLELHVPRRIVTGHDESGRSVVLSDGPVPVSRELPADRVGFHEVWVTEQTPAPIAAVEPGEPTERVLQVPPPRHGTRIRVNEFLPGGLDENGLQSPVHRTESVDYGIVIEGEITLLLDDSEVVARAGDIIVQRGTSHAWANRGDTPARVVFVLIGGSFEQSLLDVLPDDVHADLMRHGPRD